MAKILQADLQINREISAGVAECIVRCKIEFTRFEYCLMSQCEGHLFKLKCELMGRDEKPIDEPEPVGSPTVGIPNSGLPVMGYIDDHLYTFEDVYWFPDRIPNKIEERVFSKTIGQSILDEDVDAYGPDEIYSLLTLKNVFANVVVTKRTNIVTLNI